VRPFAIRVMAELGVDISGRESKTLDRFLDQRFDKVITVCDRANETCPVFFGAKERIHWSFPDPSAAVVPRRTSSRSFARSAMRSGRGSRKS
jgi:arsenate reductase (thioredoxin)